MEKVPVEKENRGTEIILSQEKTESEYLEKIVVDCWNIYETGKIYAPYFALVQSSGSGKTTCMKLLSQNQNFIVQYILLNSVEPTELATKFEGMIKQACEITETYAKGLICEFLEKLFDFKGRNNAAKIFVLCIDEARWLCDQEAKYHRNERRTAFELLRKTLCEFTKSLEKKLVIVLADTVSVVGNFVLAKSKFNPHMKTNVQPPTLFPVIYRIPFFDIFA